MEFIDRHAVKMIIEAVEGICGRKWNDFRDVQGDWGRDMVLYVARYRSGKTLKEIGEAVGNMNYKAVGKAVERFQHRLKSDTRLAAQTSRCVHYLSFVEIRPQYYDATRETHAHSQLWFNFLHENI